MNSLQFLSYLIEQFGLYAGFFLTMLEGDMTLLLAGVLAHSGFFAEGIPKGYGFAKVLFWGTLGGVASDNLAYGADWSFAKTVRDIRFYRSSISRMERLT